MKIATQGMGYTLYTCVVQNIVLRTEIVDIFHNSPDLPAAQVLIYHGITNIVVGK